PRSVVPAITHIDYSARVQTVDAQRHGRFYRLLKRFHEATGCPVLINTSFNVRGEPIVGTPADAYRCFMGPHMHVLGLEKQVLRPGILRPLYLALTIGTYPVGWVVSHVVLAVIFYGVFTAVALVFRLLGRDALQRRLEPEAASYWQPRTPSRDPRTYFQTF